MRDETKKYTDREAWIQSIDSGNYFYGWTDEVSWDDVRKVNFDCPHLDTNTKCTCQQEMDNSLNRYSLKDFVREHGHVYDLPDEAYEGCQS